MKKIKIIFEAKPNRLTDRMVNKPTRKLLGNVLIFHEGELSMHWFEEKDSKELTKENPLKVLKKERRSEMERLEERLELD